MYFHKYRDNLILVCIKKPFAFYRFQLNGEAIDALLKLISDLLPQPNMCLKSVYTFKKYFSNLCDHIEIRRELYCTECISKVSSHMNSCHGQEKVGYFVMSNIGKQLKEIFQGG